MRSLLLGTAVAVAIASPAYANKGVDIMSKRLIEAKQRAINAGYTAITFAEFKAGADGFVAKGTKIALPVGGFVFDAAGNGYLYPVSVSEDGESFRIDRNEVKKIPVGLKNSPPEIAAKFIDQCSSVDFCSMILVGHATQCAWTNVFGNTANIPCFAVEAVYGTAEMVDEAVEANRPVAASRPTIPAAAPAPKRQISLSLHLQPNPRKSIPVPYRLPPQRSRSRREGERHPLRRGIMTESSGKHGSVGWSGNSKMARYVGVDALD